MTMQRLHLDCFLKGVFIVVLLLVARFTTAAEEGTTKVISLDGTWQLATDPQNVGREQQWFQSPRPEAKPAKVPWIIQGMFPGYHGVAWYWRDLDAPANPHPKGRTLLVNMLRYAARDVAKLLADQPSDFEAQLKTFGY
jgi:hypothetical protein